MCCSDLGRDWLPAMSFSSGLPVHTATLKTTNMSSKVPINSRKKPPAVTPRGSGSGLGMCINVLHGCGVRKDASVMSSLACGRDIIRQPDARVVAIVVDAHEEETATHDAPGDLGRDVHECSGGSEVPAHG